MNLLKQHIWLPFWGCLLFFSCGESMNYRALLVQADSLMWIYPDSALKIIKKVPAERLYSEADKAYYALLLTQARYRNYELQQNDSLIQIAINYYYKQKDINNLVRAYYYLGGIYDENKMYPEALRGYYHALKYADKSDNAFWRLRIRKDISYIYTNNELYTEADSVLQQAKDIAVIQKDSMILAELLIQQGRIQIFSTREYSVAEKKLFQAERILKKDSSNHLYQSLSDAFCHLYCRTKQGEKALHYANFYRQLCPESIHSYFLLGEVFYRLTQYDSATCYFNKILTLSSSYNYRKDTYMRLADIAKKQGDIALSLQLERKYSAYQDSLSKEMQRQNGDLFVAKKEVVLYQQEQKHIDYIIYIVSLIIFICLLVYVLHRHHQKKHADLQNLAKQKEDSIGQQIQILQEERRVMGQRAARNTDAYAKIERILNDYKTKGFSKELLNEEEWLVLQTELDKNNIIEQLRLQYKLSSNEVHLCILYLFDFSITDVARIYGQTRQTIYRIEKNVLIKIGEEYKAGKLMKLLRNR